MAKLACHTDLPQHDLFCRITVAYKPASVSRLDLTLLWCKSYDMHGRGNSLASKQQLYSSSHQCAPPVNLKTKNRKEKQKEENKTKEMRNFILEVQCGKWTKHKSTLEQALELPSVRCYGESVGGG